MHPHPLAVGRPLFDVELKIARARQHAEELGELVRKWLKENPPAVHAELISERHGYRLLAAAPKVRPDLEYWGLLVGDCVHNLRSALDNLCYAFARVKRDPPEHRKKIFFPVCSSEEAFREKKVRDSLTQLPAEVAQAIELWQPYQRGEKSQVDRDALLLLHEISTEDKHRIPQVVLLALGQRDHGIQLEFFSEEDATAFMEGPPSITLHAGELSVGETVICEVVGSRSIKNASGKLTAEMVPAIRTLVGLEGAIPTVEALGVQAQNIFHHLRMFYPGGKEDVEKPREAKTS